MYTLNLKGGFERKIYRCFRRDFSEDRPIALQVARELKRQAVDIRNI